MTRPKADASPRIFLTGFEPFGGLDYNPSWEVAKGCAAVLERGGDDIHTSCLPVTFAIAEQWGKEHLGASEQDLVLHFGLANSRAHISLEQVARAQTSQYPDNDGVCLSLERLDSGQAIETALDLDALASALNDVHSEQDVASPWPEVRVTTDAGAYVCNAIYYYSLCAHPGNRVVFVHLPMQSAEVAFRQGELLGEAMLRLTWEGAGSRLTLNV
jgi:pyroglutamyl-peptidase